MESGQTQVSWYDQFIGIGILIDSLKTTKKRTVAPPTDHSAKLHKQICTKHNVTWWPEMSPMC